MQGLITLKVFVRLFLTKGISLQLTHQYPHLFLPSRVLLKSTGFHLGIIIPGNNCLTEINGIQAALPHY